MQQKIILHEIGHHLAHKEGAILYRMQRERLKMEHEADCFMLKEEVKNYLSCNDIISTQLIFCSPPDSV